MKLTILQQLFVLACAFVAWIPAYLVGSYFDNTTENVVETVGIIGGGIAGFFILSRYRRMSQDIGVGLIPFGSRPELLHQAGASAVRGTEG